MDISLKWTASRRGRRVRDSDQWQERRCSIVGVTAVGQMEQNSVTEHMRNFWLSAMMKVSNTEAMPTYIEGCFVENDSTGPAAHSHDMVCGYCGHRISVLESNRWNG
jgi:hypothetical protein